MDIRPWTYQFNISHDSFLFRYWQIDTIRWIVAIIWLSQFGLCFLSILQPKSQFFRFLFGISSLLMLCLFRELNPDWNAKDTSVFVAFFLGCISTNSLINPSSAKLNPLYAIRLIVATPYLLSGLHKALHGFFWKDNLIFYRILVTSPLKGLYLPDDSILGESLYRSIIFHGFSLTVLTSAMLLAPFAALSKKSWSRIWASILISFHLISGLTLDIFYVPQLCMLLVFFIIKDSEITFTINSIPDSTIDNLRRFNPHRLIWFIPLFYFIVAYSLGPATPPFITWRLMTDVPRNLNFLDLRINRYHGKKLDTPIYYATHRLDFGGRHPCLPPLMYHLENIKNESLKTKVLIDQIRDCFNDRTMDFDLVRIKTTSLKLYKGEFESITPVVTTSGISND